MDFKDEFERRKFLEVVQAIARFRHRKMELEYLKKDFINKCRKCKEHKLMGKDGHKCACLIQRMQDLISEVL